MEAQKAKLIFAVVALVAAFAILVMYMSSGGPVEIQKQPPAAAFEGALDLMSEQQKYYFVTVNTSADGTATIGGVVEKQEYLDQLKAKVEAINPKPAKVEFTVKVGKLPMPMPKM